MTDEAGTLTDLLGRWTIVKDNGTVYVANINDDMQLRPDLPWFISICYVAGRPSNGRTRRRWQAGTVWYFRQRTQ